MRILPYAAAAALVLVSTRAEAQALGPQRQLLSLEPFYSRVEIETGSGSGRTGLNGYGLLFWLNLAPFSGPTGNLVNHTGLGLFTSWSPGHGPQNISTFHFGAEFDIHPINYPIAGSLDPFISLGLGLFRTRSGFQGSATSPRFSSTRFALTPGVGLRIPLANRFQLRGDARDAIVFGNGFGVPSGGSRTTHTFEFRGGLGLTF